jgi:homoserine kinase type II
MAVYTKISQSELEHLISGYNIGTLKSFTGIEAGVQNSNYFVNTTKARYVLTIFERNVDNENLPFFLNLVGHLAKKNIPCPALILDKNNEGLKEIKGKPCAITSFLKGGELEIIETEHLEELGANIAKMHLASKDFTMQRKNTLSMDGTSEITVFESLKNRIDEIAPGLKEEVEKNLDFLKKNWPKDLPSGIIHGDIFPDNIFFNDDKLVGIIDFYFACNDILMYDLAICINSWCFEENNEFNHEKVNALISSYNKVRKISQEELNALPTLAQGAAMRFLLTRIEDFITHVEDAIVTQKDPMEYLQKLRFHSKIKSYTDYQIQINNS